MRDLSPPRVPGPLFAAAGYFLPRLMFLNSRHAPQVHWGDVARALDGFPEDLLDLGSAAFWDEWRERWCAVAEEHEHHASLATTVAGRSRAHRSAAACFHWAEFMDFGDSARKFRLRSRVRAAFRLALEGTDLDVTAGVLPWPGSGDVPYWLVLPPRRGSGAVPCVVVSNGLDSMTEVEPLALAEAYLERGIAALLFDGPGQGLSVGQVPLLVEMETVVAALLDRLADDARIDTDRLAFLGISFGGHLALRVAAALGPRLRCVVNLSGGPVVAPFAGLPRRLKDDFRFALMASDDAEVQRRFDLFDVGGRPPDTDVLSVHGALDDIFPVEALAELDRAWGPRHRLVVHPREAHVCLTLVDRCASDAADWVAGHLTTDTDTDTDTERPTMPVPVPVGGAR